MISRLFALWIDGLAAALLGAESLLHRPRRFRLQANSHPFTLHSLEGSKLKLLLSIGAEQVDKLPAKVLQQTRGGIIEIVVPAAAILERRLEPLPAESRPYLEKVALHQLDNIFPWRSADILHTTLIEKRADGMLDVSIRATPRSAIEPALVTAAKCGARKVLIVGDGEDTAAQRASGIPMSTAPENAAKLNRARLIAQYGVVAIIALTACVVGWTTFAGWSLANDVAALDQAIADRRAILRRTLASTDTGQNYGLEEKKKLVAPAVVVLEELSSLLPDDTYLTELSFESDQLRITGVSTNAVGLVPLLEGSGHFKNASFYVPTTRLSGSTSDRFSIEAVVISQPPVKP